MRPLRTLVLCTLALAAGCGRSPSPPPAAPAASPAPGAATSGPQGPMADAPAPTPRGPTAYVNALSVLRRQPTDAARIPGKPGGKEQVNQLAVLHRGEKVAVLETREDWARVRSSDDAGGWMRRTSLLELEGITEATVLATADVFDRPDLLAANTRRKIEPGTLVLVVKARPPFTEVNVSGSQDAWVLSERLETSEREVSVAKLIEKARTLVRANKKDEAVQLLALARQNFGGAALLDRLATELGEAPAQAESPTPAAAPPAPPTDPPAAGRAE